MGRGVLYRMPGGRALLLLLVMRDGAGVVSLVQLVRVPGER